MDTITGWAGSLHASVAVFAVAAAACWPVALVMLFVIQQTTNRQTGAILLKLDELIVTSATARDEVIDAERRDTAEQEKLHDRLHH